MSEMLGIEKPKDRAPIITICGDSGLGKTTLAASFPKPIFIRAEDGLQAIAADARPDAFPRLENFGQLISQLMALIKNDHTYKTVVLDSVTTLERMFVDEVVSSDPKAKSIKQAAGGYGAGAEAVANMHTRVRKACGILNEQRQMNVVFLAHADIETMRLPDADDFMRYSLRMPSKSLPPYVDEVDLVGFIRLVQFVSGKDGERAKAVSTGARQIICHASAANVSKNRFNIDKPIDFVSGANPFEGLFPINGIGKFSPDKPATQSTQQPSEPTGEDQ